MTGSRRVVLAILAAALALVGCQPPSGLGPGGGRGTPRPAKVEKADGAGGGTAAGGVGNHGSSLIGKVRMPAGLVRSGGSIVSDNGGGIVSNHGGNFRSENGGGLTGARRLTAIDQVPVAEVAVRVLDAGGKPVMGADGRPLETRTDAAGAYVFPGFRPARNMVVQADLPSGPARAFALRGGEGAVDVDLVSTLTAGYVLGRYVAGQADPLATLDRLPADAERQTRGTAEAALAAGKAAGRILLPTTLATTAVLALVDELRAADRAFDGQMEAVRRLLVAAGQRDLGEGQPAFEVPLGWISGVGRAQDGTVFLACREDDRIWRLSPDGRLRTAVGRVPNGPDADVEGRPGPETAIDLEDMLVEPDGGLMILERTRVLRLTPDGKVHVLAADLRAPAPQPDTGGAVVEEEPDAAAFSLLRDAGGARYLVETRGYQDEQPDRVLALREGQPPVAVHAFPLASEARLGSAGRFRSGRPGEAVTLAGDRSPRRLDLATFAIAPIPGIVAPGEDPYGLIMDGAGDFWRADEVTRRLARRSAPAVSLDLPPGEPHEVPNWLEPEPGGTVLAPIGTKLWRLGPEGPRLIAGLGAPAASGPPADGPGAQAIALADPSALAVDGDGTLRIYDRATRRLWRVSPAGEARLVATFDRPFPAPGTPDAAPAESTMVSPSALWGGPGDTTWLADGEGAVRVLVVAPDGGIRFAFRPHPEAFVDEELVGTPPPLVDAPPPLLAGVPTEPAGLQADQANVTPDGTLVLVLDDASRLGPGGVAPRYLELRPPGGRPERHALPDVQAANVVPMPDGSFLLENFEGALWRWRRGQAATPVTDIPAAWRDRNDGGWDISNREIQVDARGRLYNSTGADILRWDPATGAVTTIAGSRGQAFRGATVDTTVGTQVRSPRLDAAGNLYFLDPEHRQVKRIPAAELR